MYEARQQAYIELVQMLLDGGIGNENEILAAHSELVDAGLIVILRERAQSFQQKNDRDSALMAEWLIGISDQLVRQLELEMGNESEFFRDVLTFIGVADFYEQNYDFEEVYPLLQDNLLLLNEQLVERILASKKPASLDSDKIGLEILATLYAIFAIAIDRFPLGSKEINLELAIASYCAALDRLDQKGNPVKWAAIQYNLGSVYYERIKGDKHSNIEAAITHHQLALTTSTYELYPEDWAMSQRILGDIYSDRLLGDRKNNLICSQEYYQAALEVYTVDKYPEDWAEVQLDLARLNINGFRNYKAAIDLLQNTYEHLLIHKYSLELLAEAMFELAQCLHHIGQLEQAKLLLKDTIRLYQRLEQPTKIAAVTGALGNLELQMGKLTNARLHLQQALDFYHSAGDQKQVVAIQNLQEYLSDPVAQGAS